MAMAIKRKDGRRRIHKVHPAAYGSNPGRNMLIVSDHAQEMHVSSTAFPQPPDSRQA
jgi:hypothetical protein